MTEPWAPEYPLDADTVLRAVTANTDLSPSECTKLGEGWDFFCSLLDAHWVFRFPKRRSEVERLVAERELLDRLRLSISVPRYAYWIDDPDGFHLPFAGYAFLPGTPLDRSPIETIDRIGLARDLGRILEDLHAQALTPERAARDPVAPWIRDWRRDRLSGALREDLLDLCERALCAYVSAPPGGKTVTTHNDLGLEHVIMDTRGRLSAIIDWGDAASTDRYVDFAALWALGGDALLEAALAHYSHRPSAADRTRTRTHGLIYALGQVEYGNKSGDTELAATATRWLIERAETGDIEKMIR